MVCLSLTKHDLLGIEPVSDLVSLIQKYLILGRSLIYIAGEHPVIRQDQKNPHQKIDDSAGGGVINNN